MVSRFWSAGIPGLLVLAAVAAGCNHEEDGRLEGSGTIEADEIRVSSTVGGVILEVLAQEGDKVEKGQVLMRFDPSDIEIQARQARAGLAVAKAKLALARKGARREDIEAAKEMMKQAQAGEAAAKADLARAEKLFKEGGVTEKQLADARTLVKVRTSQRKAAELQYKKALRGARPEEIEMAEAGVANAEALLALAEKKIADCEVKAPISGTIVHRLVEPGEVAGPGATLFVMQNIDTVKLTVFVPEPDVGRVRIGDQVKVYIDSHPDRAFEGRVSRIRENAEFTPRNVQTKDERVKLVFGIEITLPNPEGFLKPGLPADAVLAEAPAQAAGTAG